MALNNNATNSGSPIKVTSAVSAVYNPLELRALKADAIKACSAVGANAYVNNWIRSHFNTLNRGKKPDIPGDVSLPEISQAGQSGEMTDEIIEMIRLLIDAYDVWETDRREKQSASDSKRIAEAKVKAQAKAKARKSKKAKAKAPKVYLDEDQKATLKAIKKILKELADPQYHLEFFLNWATGVLRRTMVGADAINEYDENARGIAEKMLNSLNEDNNLVGEIGTFEALAHDLFEIHIQWKEGAIEANKAKMAASREAREARKTQVVKAQKAQVDDPAVPSESGATQADITELRQTVEVLQNENQELKEMVKTLMLLVQQSQQGLD